MLPLRCSLLVFVAFTWATAHAAGAPKGERVFFTGHSFHMFVPAGIATLVKEAEIAGHQTAGTQGLGGSRVIQHWDLPDTKDQARKALATGSVDVLTLAPNMKLPDEGIDRFVDLAVKHNPKVRVLVQASWMTWDGKGGGAGFRNADRDALPVADIRAATEEHVKQMREQLSEINARHGKPVAFLVPAGTAVVRLRELVAEGKVPGITHPSKLFRDDIGHANDEVSHLVIYVNYAALYRRSPAGLPGLTRTGAIPTAPSEVELLLQDIAWKTVIAEPLSGVAVPPPAQ
jgi:hypothetical protein